jgi:putative ABC transport system permease protein
LTLNFPSYIQRENSLANLLTVVSIVAIIIAIMGVMQLLIAFVIAAPAAYYISNRWLETFAYKISVQWWVFVLCWLCMCLIIAVTISVQTYRAATKNPVDAIKNE